jgi:DNA-binding CsgD family transcriptional regulator
VPELLAVAEELAHLGSWELDLASGRRTWSDHMYGLMGHPPGPLPLTDEATLELIHPEDRDRVAAVREEVTRHPDTVAAEGVTVECRVTRPDGSIVHLRSLGRIERDQEGRSLRWYGCSMDVTDDVWRARALEALHSLCTLVSTPEPGAGGLNDLMRNLALALDFPLSVLWTRPYDRITERASYRSPDVEPASFEPMRTGASFAPGEGPIGEAWRLGQPLILRDLPDRVISRERRAAVQELGLRSGWLVPAVLDGQTLALLSLYSFDRREADDFMLRSLTSISEGLGGLLGRRRAELGGESLSPRELEVLGLAAQGNSVPDIARRLEIASSTVRSHFDNLYVKLGVSDRAAAVAQGIRQGLIR